MAHPSRQALAPARAAAAGLAAMFAGIGIGRFAYTPLIPALVGAGWYGPGEAAAFGAANLVGYLAGAAAALPLARLCPLPWLMRGMMVLVAAATALAALRPEPLVFGAARVAAGVAGGTLMVLGPPSLLAAVPIAVRGRVGGAVFAGVGAGIVAASLALPVLFGSGLPAAWLGLGAAALGCAAVAWPFWPPEPPPAPPPGPAEPGLARLILAYAVSAFAIVPHMLLLSDYVARWLGRGVGWGATAFAVYGAGAMLGPVVGGAVGDRIGFRRTLSLALLLQAVAVALPALLRALPATLVSGLVVGALTPGIPPLVLARAGELAGMRAAARSWRSATIAYALAQAFGAFAAAAAFARLRAHPPLFVAGAVFSLAALAALPRARARDGAGQ
jgi:predicted MFS family arabinose efflux permease